MTISAETYQKKFIAKALNNGYSDDNIKKCLDYAIPLIQKDLPVIYNTSHFSLQVGYNTTYVKKAIKFTSHFYRNFSIKKDNGQLRNLHEPLPSLKEIQNWILKEILYKNKVSRYAKGYVPNRSIKEHTIYHTGVKEVLTLDIKDFFNTIDFSLVEKLFLDMGYSKRISNLITKICYLEENLPQGAPTSPYISNLILLNFDKVIGQYSLDNNIKYTRYADDLAFSGNLDKDIIIQTVKDELDKLGLKLNINKTKLMRQNDPQLISGIIVNKKPQVPKRERNQIRNTLHYIKKFGLENHMKHTSQNRRNYLKHLKGKVNYILQINPRDEEFKKYKEYLSTL